MSSSPGASPSEAERLKLQGNDAFRKGDLENAIASYSSALDCVESPEKNGGHPSMLSATLLSNRAMCRLKLYETRRNHSQRENKFQGGKDVKVLRNCIEDCTAALETLASSGTSDGVNESESNRLRGKVLYRRAKALAIGHDPGDDDSNDAHGLGGQEDALEKDLNSAAKDLLQLLSFDPQNKEAASLLRFVRARHGSLGGGMGRSRISRALDNLRGVGDDSNDGDNEEGIKKGIEGTLQCLRVIQASLADDSASSSEEIGRRGGVAPLLKLARHGVTSGSFRTGGGSSEEPETAEKCRVLALHILSACCSHDSFVMQYGSRENLPPAMLAQIVEEEAALSNSVRHPRSADIAVAAIALLIRLIVHWNHQEVAAFFANKIKEDGTFQQPTGGAPQRQRIPEIDGSSICRVASAALLWDCSSSNNNSKKACDKQILESMDGRAPRAALDLLSAWTASDLDALDAVAYACHSSSPGNDRPKHQQQHLQQKHRLTQDEIRQMKPRQVAGHRKREAEYRRANLQRAIQHVTMFCNDETGGLDAMLMCASGTRDHRLRREVGLQIGRLLSLLEEDNDVKKLVAPALGCDDWSVGGSPNQEEKEPDMLTIEELDEDDSDANEEEKECVSEKDGESGTEISQSLLAIMKRGQLTASLILGKPEVGTWALKHGWANGGSVAELKKLISSNDSRSMSIASELLSAASSVESCRPFLAAFVQEGTLEDLLIHPDADVRSGAASCAAKIGLASKALSEDEGEVMELLDVAIELIFEEDENFSEKKLSTATKTLSLTTKDSESKVSPETTSMDRGIEVLTYLAAKTFVKEKITNGYKPEGSSPNRDTALQRLVEIACAPNSGVAQLAYGLAGIFNLLSVSIETLQKEAFVGKEITKEQYDQLQALGKTAEEKEAESKKDETEGDTPAAVRERIRKLANANVPRGMVKLMDGSSNTTQEKLLEGMGRMASEQSVRGIMIQQGCLSACLNVDKGEKPSEIEKKILRQARSCIAKLLVTTNPNILTVSQRSGSIGPLIKLVRDSDALDLMHFEALLSLTNLAAFGDETKNRIVAQKGIPALSYAMFSDHEMVRQAATEAMCNMVPHPEMMSHLAEPDNLRIWVAFASDFEENFACARAAVGCLAMAVPDPVFADSLIKIKNFGDMVRMLMECGQLELMHRVLALVAGLIEHGGACRQAVVATGAGPFCEAYVSSYHDGKKLEEFNFSPEERGSFAATLSLAKEVARLLR